jgi:hypothetical protein
VHADLVAPSNDFGNPIGSLLAVATFDEHRGRQSPALEHIEQPRRAVVEVVDGEAGNGHLTEDTPLRARQLIVAVRPDCRHYSTRTLPSGEVVERCRVDANEKVPFACPEGCLFFEPRAVSDAGWTQAKPKPDD